MRQHILKSWRELDYLIVSFNGLLLFGLLLASGIQEVGELLIGSLVQLGLLPQIRGQVGIGIGKSSKGSLDEVSEGLGASLGLSEDILNACILKNFLGSSGSDDSSTTRSRYESHANRTTLSSDLGGDSVRSSDLVTPISSSDWDNGELGSDDSTTNGSGNFLGAFHTETNMAVVITNDNKGLESSSLTCTCLLLDWHDLHYFILQFATKKPIYYLVLLDGQGIKVDLL